MAQPADDAQTSHVVINVVDDAEPATRSCCVCTGSLEWVAFGPCRHPDYVCVGCAMRIRFFGNEKRCCICRTYCPNVIVTHVDSRLDDLPFFSSMGSLGRHYWYHGGMGAYFDDQDQYEMATEACAKPPPRPDTEINNNVEAETPVNQLDDDGTTQQPAGGVVNRRNRDEPLSEPCLAAIFVGLYLCVILFLATMWGPLFLAAAAYYQKVAAVIAFGLLSAAATIYAIWSWPKFKATLLNC